MLSLEIMKNKSILNLIKTPRGNTCEGVNKAIIKYLYVNYGGDARKSLLDIPCGGGEFINATKSFFPNMNVKGCDLPPSPPNSLQGREYESVDASKPFDLNKEFDIITSISGVMEFDNTTQFLESCHKHMKENGILVITNDNHASIYDR